MLTSCQWRSFVALLIFFYFLGGTIKSYGVLAERTVKDFSTQHFAVGWAFSFQLSTCLLVAPLVRLFQRNFDDRLLAICGGILASLGYIIQGFIYLTSVLQLIALTGIVGIGFGLLNVVTVTSVKISFQESFPFAYIMATTGLNVGAATMPILLERLVNLLDRQRGLLVLGVFIMNLTLIGVIMPGSEATSDTKSVADSETSQLMSSSQKLPSKVSKSITVSESLSNWKPFSTFVNSLYQHPQALFLYLIQIIVNIENICWSLYLVPYGEFLGLEPTTAVWLSTIGGSSAFVGRVFSIIVLYHQNVSYRLMCFLLPSLVMVIGYLFSLFFDSFLVISLSALLSGLSVGVQTALPVSVLPHWICDDCFTNGLVWLYTLAGVVNLLGAIMIGGIVDVTGSYRVAFACLAVLSFLETIVTLIWMIMPDPRITTCNLSD